MVRQFKELNMALKIERHALNDRTKQLKALEAKTNPSAFDRKEMVRLRNLIDNNNKKLSRLEGQMVKATTETRLRAQGLPTQSSAYEGAPENIPREIIQKEDEADEESDI